MELTLTTPALLFPTVSLLMLGYTNRFVAISSRIRQLHEQYRKENQEVHLKQIKILKKRITLIRDMQLYGILAIFLATLTMFLLYEGFVKTAYWSFTIALLFLLISLGMAAIEIILSNKALNIQIQDLEEQMGTEPSFYERFIPKTKKK